MAATVNTRDIIQKLKTYKASKGWRLRAFPWAKTSAERKQMKFDPKVLVAEVVRERCRLKNSSEPVSPAMLQYVDYN